MNFKCKKENIINLVSRAEKIADKNISLPILSNIVLEAKDDFIFAYATNLDIGVEIKLKNKIEENGKVAISGQILNSFLGNLPKNDNELEFKLENSNLEIQGKTSKSKINTFSCEEFPGIPEIITTNFIKIKAKDFIDGLKSVWYASAVSSIKPELSSVYLYSENGKLIFVATDSFRLAEKRIDFSSSNENFNILIPFKNAIEIVRILDGVDEELKIYIEDSQIGIITENIKIISRIVEGNFPDYKQIIPKGFVTKVTVLSDDFKQAFKAVGIFSDKFNQTSLEVDSKNNVLIVKTESQEKGLLINKINIKTEGEDVVVNFNHKYILDSFNSINSDSLVLEFNGKVKPMIIRGLRDSNFTYIVMPMNK